MLFLYIVICCASYLTLLWHMQRQRDTLGLPIAYLFALLLIHVPGAIAHWIAPELFVTTSYVTSGMQFAAMGSVAFLAGVWAGGKAPVRMPAGAGEKMDRFARFCVLGGLVLTFVVTPLLRIPSVAAVIQGGGPVWMLGVALGLRRACYSGDIRKMAAWISILCIYPTLMLVNAGFLSYGSTAVVIVLSSLAVLYRKFLRVSVGVVLLSGLFLSVFVTYFQHRERIRASVWSERERDMRFERVGDAARDAQFLDLSNRDHLEALDLRLNQSYFLGLAIERVEFSVVDLLHGRSINEGLLALVPRLFWPDKPVFGGSPKIVSEMTGLQLSEETSFGVGQVMEFYINFGALGVIGGFMIFGAALRRLDQTTMACFERGDGVRSLRYFLPAVAMIQPNGSLVEVVGGSAAAYLAALVWELVWRSALVLVDKSVGSRRSVARTGDGWAALPR